MKTENDKLGLTTEEKNVVIKNFFPPNVSKEELAFCMGVANTFGLNPLLNQIYFVARKSKVNNQWVEKVSPMVGRDGFLTLAHKSGVFAGIETTTEIKAVPVFVNNEWVEQNDLVAICSVYRTDTERPFVVEVSFKEYAGKTHAGELTKFWKEKGATMLKKVAESQCLRKAFNVSGIYAEEEINDVQAEPKAQEITAPKEDNVTALLTEDMGNQNVNIVTGEVHSETVEAGEEMPAYMEDDVLANVEYTEPKQNTLELDID